MRVFSRIISLFLLTVSSVSFAEISGNLWNGSMAGLGSSASGDPAVAFYSSPGGAFEQLAPADPVTGAFTTTGLPPGDYFIHTVNYNGYIDIIYDALSGIPCGVSAETCADEVVNGAVVSDGASGIQIDVSTGSAFMGIIQDFNTFTPLAGVEVCVFEYVFFGAPVVPLEKCALTDASGNYRTAGFPAGDFVLATTPSSTGAYVPLMTVDGTPNTAFYNLPGGFTNIFAGISVSGTADVSVGFDLEEGSELDLTVTDSGTTDPVQQFRVSLFDGGGFPFADLIVDNPTGTFLQGIPLATTFIAVEPISSSTLTGQFVGGVDCSAFGTCGFPLSLGANSVVLTPGGTTMAATALNSGNLISGNVTGNLSPLTGANVEFLLPDGTPAGFAQADTSGDYAASFALPPRNDYRVKAFAIGTAFVPEYYDDVVSIGNDPVDGTPVDLTGGNATGINFDLAQGSLFSGTATIAGGPNLADNAMLLDLYNPSGTTFVATISAPTDPSGAFTSDFGVPPGPYKIVFRPDEFDFMGMPNYLVPELNDDIACPGGANCRFGLATVVNAIAGSNTVDVEFSEGVQVFGTVEDDQMNLLDGVPMDVFDAGGATIGGVGTMFGGQYIINIPANANYYIGTNDGVLQNELFDNVQCPNQMCSSVIGMGTPINQAPSTGAVADFILEPVVIGGDSTIAGTISRLSDGAAIANANVSLERIDGPMTLTPVGTTMTDGSGNYSFAGLSAGDYRILATATGFTVQQYGDGADDLPSQLCDNSLFCPEFATNPVTVSGALETVGDIDIAIQPAGIVGGTLIDEMSMLPVDAGFGVAFAAIFDDEGELYTRAFQNSGNPFSINLPLGTYYAVGSVPNKSGYIDTALGDTDCPFASCDLLTTVPINVTTQGQMILNLDINMPLGFTITGTIEDGAAMLAKGSPFTDAEIYVYNTLGQRVADAKVASDASWETFTGLRTADSFYLSTVDRETGQGLSFFTGQDFVDVVYDGVFCPDGLCEITAGTVAMAGGFYTITTELGTRVLGVVSDDDAMPLTDIEVQIFRDDGMANAELFALGKSGEVGFWGSSPIPDGTYFAVTDSSARGFFDEIFDDISCLGDLCETQALMGTPITASGGLTTPTSVDFELRSGTSISPADLEAQDKLGAAVAVCDGRLAVGIPGDDDLAPDAGAVLIYRKEGTGFVFEEKLYAQTPEADAMFGSAIACSGSMFVIGFPGKDSALAKGTGPDKGAAVFQLGGGATALLQQLIMSNLAQTNQFGASIAMDGGNMVIGAPNMNGAGAAVMFGLGNGLPFANQTTLTDPGGSAGDGFGMSVDVSNGNVLIGSPMGSVPGGPLGSGVAQMFSNLLGSDDWNSIGKFTNTNPSSGDQFGASVSLDGGNIAVGAPMNDAGGVDAGAAFVFSFAGNLINQQAQLLPGAGQSGDNFGSSLALANGQIAIGAPGSGASGSAFVFQTAAGIWEQIAALTGDSLGGGAGFGTTISFDGTTIFVGAPNQGASAGAAQAFPAGDRLFLGQFEQ